MNKNIRNFCIIAHIDHGKSTLADRIIEICSAIPSREMKDQILDSMDLERERGITIKLNAIQLNYLLDNERYLLNLIDTPGHVDFSYEVSRSLAATEGALLLVDSTQGIQPQTIANTYLAIENNLKIIPVINKIDSPISDVEKTKIELEEILGIDSKNSILISAKQGTNVEEVLKEIIKEIPAPKNNLFAKEDLVLFVFDSYFDPYKGVVFFVKVISGTLRKKQPLKLIRNKIDFEITEMGVNTPARVIKETLEEGEIGWVVTNLKEANKSIIGDTISNKTIKPLDGYSESKPMVFSGLYPIDTNKYQQLNDSLKKLSLSDSSLVFEKESSEALGFGFRVGFLGTLHMEIIQERIRREFNIDVIITSPSVVYQVISNKDETTYVDNPAKFPSRDFIKTVKEPYVNLVLFSPNEYIGKLMEYVHGRRGKYVSLSEQTTRLNKLVYEIPLSEIIFDFFNDIKSISKGYASFDYTQIGYKEGNLVKMDILVNKKVIDSLSVIVNRDSAYYMGKLIVSKLKDEIPRHNFEIPIQAAINNKVISRETIKAYRKDVTGDLYGGDVSRKKKLLKKQKKGKKQAKIFGSVEIPQGAFISILKKK